MSDFSMQKWADDRVRPNIAPLMPRGEADVPMFMVALRSATLNNPKLFDAVANDPNAALVQVIKAAKLGLSLDPALEHFALIPYKTRLVDSKGKEYYAQVVQGQIMVRGWIHLAQQSGAVEWLHGDVIYRQEHDKTVPLRDVATGKINHVPHDLERDDYKDEDIVAAYAMAKLKGSEHIVSRVLTRKEIEKRRAQGFGDTPSWKQWYPQMCVVKAMKALMRTGMVPLTRQQLDVAVEDDEDAPTVTVAPAKPMQVTFQPPPIVVGKDAAERFLFQARNEQPLPPPEQLQAETLEALCLLCEDVGVEVPEAAQAANTDELVAMIDRVRASCRRE